MLANTGLAKTGLANTGLANTGRPPRLTTYEVMLLGRSQTLDIRSARNVLGYEPAETVYDGLVKTISSCWGDDAMRRFIDSVGATDFQSRP